MKKGGFVPDIKFIQSPICKNRLGFKGKGWRRRGQRLPSDPLELTFQNIGTNESTFKLMYESSRQLGLKCDSINWLLQCLISLDLKTLI